MDVSKSECVGEWQCVLLYTETLWLYPSLNVLVSGSVCYFILRLCSSNHSTWVNHELDLVFVHLPLTVDGSKSVNCQLPLLLSS